VERGEKLRQITEQSERQRFEREEKKRENFSAKLRQLAAKGEWLEIKRLRKEKYDDKATDQHIREDLAHDLRLALERAEHDN
jgi:hypothetical protein